MKYVRRVQRHGVVTVPKELRQKLGIRQGDLVMLSYHEGRITIATFRSEVVPLPVTPRPLVDQKLNPSGQVGTPRGDSRVIPELEPQRRLWPRAA
ncbi:AbrB/MazE/SpoVT family DNA-binding domain-containing protein [Stomatohabitans albus]|uniref:AbrB/MazE/SpoVT family DNA-binding domain-containing protein n=1 Tax=Stomatohabitans albus TaxID=3110766 RepID=UPI00300DA15D